MTSSNKTTTPPRQPFVTQLAVRIDAINYGQHLAHDKLVTMLHEARLQFLTHLGQSELNFLGVGLILRELQVSYRQQAFYGEILGFAVSISRLTRSRLLLAYQVSNAKMQTLATASTELVYFDYREQRLTTLSPEKLTHCSLT